MLRAGLLAVVLPAAQLALGLDMSALLERGSELAELAEDNAAVPFRVLDVLAVFLVGGLGCQRQRPSLLVRFPASLPRKPMRVTLFCYMLVVISGSFC